MARSKNIKNFLTIDSEEYSSTNVRKKKYENRCFEADGISVTNGLNQQFVITASNKVIHVLTAVIPVDDSRDNAPYGCTVNMSGYEIDSVDNKKFTIEADICSESATIKWIAVCEK